MKKKEYFTIGRKDGKELVQISREVNGKHMRTDPIEIPWKPSYKAMVLEVTDDKFKEYDETESVRHITDCEDIILDKTKSKPWVRPSERYKVDHNDPEFKKFLDFCRYGDCNPNAHDDRIDALRYASKKWLKEKHDIIGNVTDVHFTPNGGLEFHVTPCNNHDTREKEKPMKTKKDIDRIVITKNDLNEVLLRAYSGDEIVEKTIAKCSPDDIFDFNIGAKLAVDRLYDGYDMTPKPKRKLYNGKIFVRADMRSASIDWAGFQVGYRYTKENRIWEVKDGKIIGLGGICRPMDLIYEDMTDEELTKLLTKSNSLYIGYYYDIVDGYFVR